MTKKKINIKKIKSKSLFNKEKFNKKYKFISSSDDEDIIILSTDKNRLSNRKSIINKLFMSDSEFIDMKKNKQQLKNQLNEVLNNYEKTINTLENDIESLETLKTFYVKTNTIDKLKLPFNVFKLKLTPCLIKDLKPDSYFIQFPITNDDFEYRYHIFKTPSDGPITTTTIKCYGTIIVDYIPTEPYNSDKIDVEENILNIKNYIMDNYGDPYLSIIKNILGMKSPYKTHLSCTVFPMTPETIKHEHEEQIIFDASEQNAEAKCYMYLNNLYNLNNVSQFISKILPNILLYTPDNE